MAFRLAGNWLYGNRRWLNPRVPEELSILARKYGEICRAFPMFERCSRERYIEIISEISSSVCGGIVCRVRKHKSLQARSQTAAALSGADDALFSSAGGESYALFSSSSDSDEFVNPAEKSQHAPRGFQQALLQHARPHQGYQKEYGRNEVLMAGHGVTSTTSDPPSSDVFSGSLMASSTPPCPVPDMAFSAGEALDQLLTAHWAGAPQQRAMGAEALEEFCIRSSICRAGIL